MGLLDSILGGGAAQLPGGLGGAHSNQNISGDQLTQVFGSGAIGQIASQLGMDHGQASGALAQVLPEVVNQLTPQGQVTGDSSDMLSQALAMIRGA